MLASASPALVRLLFLLPDLVLDQFLLLLPLHPQGDLALRTTLRLVISTFVSVSPVLALLRSLRLALAQDQFLPPLLRHLPDAPGKGVEAKMGPRKSCGFELGQVNQKPPSLRSIIGFTYNGGKKLRG
ncbi:unnamed protein product, partial [Clonostachys rosea]